MAGISNLKSRLIQSYGLLLVIFVIGMSGTPTLLGSPGITPGYDLVGSVASYVFLHLNPDHVMGNMALLIPLMGLFALVESRPLVVLIALIVVSGIIIWSIETGLGIGSSALFCALIPYIVIRGLFSMNFVGIATAVVTLFFFAGVLVRNVDPSFTGMINYGHIGGAIGGVAVAVAMVMINKRTS